MAHFPQSPKENEKLWVDFHSVNSHRLGSTLELESSWWLSIEINTGKECKYQGRKNSLLGEHADGHIFQKGGLKTNASVFNLWKDQEDSGYIPGVQ